MRVVVIGAGVAGLSASIDLARAGAEVVALEAAPAPGGKLRGVVVDGAEIDAGPTVFTMRWVFDELFDAAGARLDDELALNPLDILARHAWDPDGAVGAPSSARLDLFADPARSADAIGAFAGAAEARGFTDFCARARRIYGMLERRFMTAPRPHPVGLVGRLGLARSLALLRLAPPRPLWRALGAHFEDPRLRQLFGRYATYCGASPFEAPAVLALVAHVEQSGVWSVEGGMRAVAGSLARLAERRGATIRCGAPVAEILVERGRAAGVLLASGERVAADAVVAAGDVAALGAGALGASAADAAPATPRERRSLSAIVWTARAETDGFPLERHNVFFSRDFAREFADIFRDRRPPEAPSIYVCGQDRGPGGAASGPERLQILMNAPADGDVAPLSEKELDRCETTTFALLDRCGLRVRRNGTNIARMTPADFAERYPATGGALYGPATHGFSAAFRRAGSKTRIPGLYLASGSAHPGPGVPMATLSGRLAAAQAISDYASERRRRPAAISGGMSTLSRTTAGSD